MEQRRVVVRTGSVRFNRMFFCLWQGTAGLVPVVAAVDVNRYQYITHSPNPTSSFAE